MDENYEQSKSSKYCQGIQTPVFSRIFSVFSTKNFCLGSARSQNDTGRERYSFREKAIEPIPHNRAKFVSNVFLVKKKSGGFRPVINLRNLNQFIHIEHFTMETITNVKTMLSKDDRIVTTDVSDAYLTIPLDEEFKDYVAFTKAISILGQIKSSRLQGFSRFRQLPKQGFYV